MEGADAEIGADRPRPVSQNEANNAPHAIKRLKRELQRLTRDVTPHITAHPLEDDLFHWRGMIEGPNGTPYEGGMFHLDIFFPVAYPLKPPQIRVINKVFHPNITTAGRVCLNVLADGWSPVLTAAGLLLSISALLGDPNPDDPVFAEPAELYKRDRQKFAEVAREWTRKYASNS